MKPLVWLEYGICFTHLCKRIIDAHALHGLSAARMALRWTLRCPEVSSVVPAANTLEELVDDVAAREFPGEAIDQGLLEECRYVPARILDMIHLIDHPYEEVRSFALAAVKQELGVDRGLDEELYREAARAR